MSSPVNYSAVSMPPGRGAKGCYQAAKGVGKGWMAQREFCSGLSITVPSGCWLCKSCRLQHNSTWS